MYKNARASNPLQQKASFLAYFPLKKSEAYKITSQSVCLYIPP
jgi:hypothetical protein